MPLQNVGRRQQIFEIWIRPVPNETRLFALRAALREFQHLVDHGMTQSDFELTRGFLSKYILHYAETTSERLGYALDDRFYGVNGSHLDLYQKALQSMTLDDVNAAMRKHFQHGAMDIAIITKGAQALKDAMVNGTPSPITYSTAKPASVMEEDKHIEVFPIPVGADNVRIIPVTELFK